MSILIKFIKVLKKYIYNFFLQVEFSTYINKSQNKKKNFNTFFFVLDLSTFYANFDVLRYLIYCAIKSKYKLVNIVIIPELEILGKITSKENLFSAGNYFRQINIVYPLMNMIEDFKPNIFFAKSREDAYKFIGSSNVRYLTNPHKSTQRNLIFEKLLFRFFNKKKYIPKLKANLNNLDFIKKKLNLNENEKLITITIKNTSYKISENSNLDAWQKVASKLISFGFRVIFIRDFEDYIHNREYNSSNYYFDHAIIDPQIRLAIYELSYVNLGVCGGPFNSFIFFSDSSFLCFKSEIIKKLDYVRRFGFKDTSKNFQFPFFNSKQKIIYKEDNYKDIIDELNIFFKENNENIIL
jgi:hypothetical protein